MKKRARVHLLPTDKTSNILVNTYINETHSASRFVMSVTKDTLDQIPVEAVELRGYKYQHLYITTDDEIKKGDWYMWFDSPKMAQAGHIQSGQKIIATTDPELNKGWIEDLDPERKSTHTQLVTHQGLPKPSKKFIEDYCKAGGIDDVDVEYEEALGASNFPIGIFDLKVTSNNEIIIHLIDQEKRDCLTIEQAESICFGFYKDLVIHLESGLSTELFHGKAVFNKHLEKALK